MEEAREWLTATLTGLTSGSDASFANEATSALLVDNISDRTIDQWDGGAAQIAAQLRRETTPTIQTMELSDPQWAAELDRPYIQDLQLHSEIAGQYATFSYRGIRWQLAPDVSGDTATLVLVGTTASPTNGARTCPKSSAPSTTSTPRPSGTRLMTPSRSSTTTPCRPTPTVIRAGAVQAPAPTRFL